MADSEEYRIKRLKHEERLSRVFDEVMGLGDFAESSRGSATSSRSGGPEDPKGADETSGQGEEQPMEEEDSDGSKQEEKMEEGTGESSSPPITSSSSFAIRTNDGGGSGSAAFDDALDGLPVSGPEEDEDEDWHFALPMGSLEDVDVKKKNKNKPKTEKDQTYSSPPEPPVREDDESTDSANTSHSSRHRSPDNSRGAGVPNQDEETEDSQQKSDTPPDDPRLSPKIKDEPVDEGYDAALLPQSSIKQVKEELEHQEEELRISSVYSVGGTNTFVSPTAAAAAAAAVVPAAAAASAAAASVPSAIAARHSTAIFIPGRGAVLQAMAPIHVRPPAPITSSLQALVPVPSRPPAPPVPGSVRCSGCSKVLLKGQTAFQRKGSTQLFCSTVCLTGHLPPASRARSCFQCNKDILQPRDMVIIPGEGPNSFLNFCGQFCLSVFRHKKKTNEKIVDKWAEQKVEKKPEKQPEKSADKSVCSVCRTTGKIEHEVTLQGRLHRLCSDTCFLSWRKIRQLAMNSCEGCGLYVSSSSSSCHSLTIDQCQLNFCGPTCINSYKQTCKKSIDCACCHKPTPVSSTILERDHRGKVQLYCSTVCVGKSRPTQQHTLSGTSFPCTLCKVLAVPQYHLAMVDGTIRNFCSYDCVSVFRKSGNISQTDLTNGTSSPRDPPLSQDQAPAAPYSSYHPSHTSVPPLVPAPTPPSVSRAAADVSRLTCHHCSKRFSSKPLLFSHQGRISVFCSVCCCEDFKTQKKVLALCEFCKEEKVPCEVLYYNQDDVALCSQKCLQLFKENVTAQDKDQSWRPCSYCSGISQKTLLSHYGGKVEEFCRPHCMSQYTILYYGMARCDSCRKQGYMTEKLQCLGSVRNFCNLACLLQYCHYHFEPKPTEPQTQSQTPQAPPQQHQSEVNPVIAGVVSLANGSASQPSVSADADLTGAVPTSTTDTKNLDHASTQTDAMRVPVPRRRQMKNKSVLCRPFTLDQETMCELPSRPQAPPDATAQPSTEESTSPKPPRDPRPCNGLPARLSGRHFLGVRESDSDCRVCSQPRRKKIDEEGVGEVEVGEEQPRKKLKDCEERSSATSGQTLYYCKTCPGEPSLCPVPCFEFYHTRLIYKSALELESAGEPNPRSHSPVQS